MLHLRVKETVQRIPHTLRQGASLHNVVDGRLRFLNLFSGLVNRDPVLLVGFRVLGQIRFLDAIHLHDVLDDLAANISDFAATQDPLLDILLQQIQSRDHFERVVGVLLGVLLRNLLLYLLWNIRLVPLRLLGKDWSLDLVVKLCRCVVDLRFQRTGSDTM